MITASGGTPETTVGDHRRAASRGPQVPHWRPAFMVIGVSIDVIIGMVILQALAMDRSLGPRFNIPAGSITVCSFAAFIAATPVLERAVFPLWCRATGALPTPMKRVGLGHFVNIAGMVVAALVERRRLGIVSVHHGANEAPEWVTPMSVLWLLIPLGLVGAGEACISRACRRFLLLWGSISAVSTVFVDVVRRVTTWLPGNINLGRLDNLYWALAVTATVNSGYFLICVLLYKSSK
ncbi:hypothetical protein HU200_009282 [Digitaria exilis]|uniref:Uncharacterized protein n=1 Tax=Digitaria exilis TaxID=1010633 RepID=A0A835DY15_9POAL|nr:hypothetical protein HU200_062757 [Digitaria exilis]KAF8762600.1 hypothetical protein HU200_009282 [Digitaria exilis]